MSEYIERGALLATYRKWLPQLVLEDDAGDRRGVETCIKVLEQAPADDVVEVKHGYNLNDLPSLFECSVCHWECYDTYTGDTDVYNYCPNCGAKMDKEGG